MSVGAPRTAHSSFLLAGCEFDCPVGRPLEEVGPCGTRCAARRATGRGGDAGSTLVRARSAPSCRAGKTGRQYTPAWGIPTGGGKKTGRLKGCWSFLPGVDVGRGLAAGIDPRYPGYEFWGSSAVGLVDVAGLRISDSPSSTNFAVWWDADLLREIEDGNWIGKWDWNTATLTRLLTADGASSNNGSKATPVLKSLTAAPDLLWPVDHKMVDVTVSAALVDLLDPAPAARIVSVSSNEPADGLGDGDTSPDWEITGGLTLRLRAERAGTGSGREYTITVEASDASGNTTIQTVVVSVPKNRSTK